jgi:hypothetical protein
VTHGPPTIGQAPASRARVILLDGALESRVRVPVDGVHGEGHRLNGAAGAPAKVASPSHPRVNAPAGNHLLGDLLPGRALENPERDLDGLLTLGAALENLERDLGLLTHGVPTIGQNLPGAALESLERVLEVEIGAADLDGVLLK